MFRKILVTFVITLTFVLFYGVYAYAEVENNDTYETADHLAINGSISGVISSKDDVDCFYVVPDANGKLTLIFNHPYMLNWDGWWNVQVFVPSGQEYTRLLAWNVLHSDDEAFELPYIGVEKGNTYYIKVFPVWSGAIGVNYTLQAKLAKSGYYEREENNSPEKATQITPGKTYRGMLADESDLDYYMIRPEASGKLSLSFHHQKIDREGTWCVRVYAQYRGEYSTLTEKFVYVNGNEKTTLPYVGVEKGMTYYIEISKDDGEFYSYPGPLGIGYVLNTKFEKSDFYEKELNESYNNATIIKPGKTYQGILNSSDDVDCYLIRPSASGRVEVSFNNKSLKKTDGWNVRVEELTKGKYTAITKELKHTSSGSYFEAKKGSEYYVTISGKASQEGKNYNLLSVQVAAPKVSAKPVSKSEIKLSWKKVSNATGYAVYRYNSATGKYKKIATTASNAYTVKGLKAGTKYSYAVKAYTTISGVDFYSDYSATVATATKCAAPSVTLKTTKSKTVTATWKEVKGAKKYIIYKSDGSEWVKAGSTTGLQYTLKKLTGGKKISVKVVAVNQYGYNGIHSSVKSIKVKK